MTTVIETDGLSRRYGAQLAVDGLALRVEAGDIFGMLGPNGAGKTTTIRILSTLLAPTGGTARVCGFDVMREARSVRDRIGYVMQNVPWQANFMLTAREQVEVEAALHHVPRRQCKDRAAEVLDLVGLTQDADKRIGQYSGGMQKRLDLACGLLHKPDVLILDEPSLGLDVQSRHRVWDHIRDLRRGGVTVLVATNYMDEADQLCNRLMIMDHGREVISGTPEDLKRAIAADVVQVTTPTPDALREAMDGLPWVQRIALTDTGDVHAYVDDASAALPAIMRLSLERGIELGSETYSRPTLDDVFLLHTGRELREEEVPA